MYLDDLIKTKWKSEDNERFCRLDKFGNNFYLHTLFKKADKSYYDNIEQNLNIKLLPELKTFYEYYNGCKLFSDSISIYGVTANGSNAFDFIINNMNKRSNLKECNNSEDYVFIGSIADFEMYYLNSEGSNAKIYLSKNGETKIYKTFSSIKDVIIHYYFLFEKQYDNNGNKIKPNNGKTFKVFPILSNMIISGVEEMEECRQKE